MSARDLLLWVFSNYELYIKFFLLKIRNTYSHNPSLRVLILTAASMIYMLKTGEMEVKNPMFHDDPTPATPAAQSNNKEEDHI